MKRSNEASAADALSQIMHLLTGAKYIDEGSPDEANRLQKEVDYILRPEEASHPPLAVEHTRVEAFRGQMTYVNRSFDIIELVNEQCAGRLPADRYFILVVPDQVVDSLRKKAITEFIESISPWVIATADQLKIDDYKKWLGEDGETFLMCGGSHPEINGTVGRIPRRPTNQEDLAEQSLWFAIQHGLGKFSKYKKRGFDTVMSLQDISGEIHPSMLARLEAEPEKQELISHQIDYIVVFASNEDRLIVATVWKEKEARYDPIPFRRRFLKDDGKWIPME